MEIFIKLVDPHLHQKGSLQNRHKERDRLCNDNDLGDPVLGTRTFPCRLQLVDILIYRSGGRNWKRRLFLIPEFINSNIIFVQVKKVKPTWNSLDVSTLT